MLPANFLLLETTLSSSIPFLLTIPPSCRLLSILSQHLSLTPICPQRAALSKNFSTIYKNQLSTSTMSYAEIAAKGPKQSPEEAAAPAMPEIEPSESAASTVSLIDVDTPSIRTVPSDFGEQSVTTETQAERLEQEAAAAAAEAKVRASKAAARARSQTEGTAKRAASQARRADRWITAHFAAVQEDHPVVAQAAVVGNFAAVIGLGALLGFRAWGLYDQGRFSWKAGAAGLGLFGAVSLFEGFLASYFYKGKPKQH